MKGKSTQRKLELWLSKWRKFVIKSSLSYNWDALDEQTYNQIKKIVEEHFKYNYLKNDPECKSKEEK